MRLAAVLRTKRPIRHVRFRAAVDAVDGSSTVSGAYSPPSAARADEQLSELASSRLDTCRTLSFCPSLSLELRRCAVWRCLRGLAAGANGRRNRRRGLWPRAIQGGVDLRRCAPARVDAAAAVRLASAIAPPSGSGERRRRRSLCVGDRGRSTGVRGLADDAPRRITGDRGRDRGRHGSGFAWD